jgi:FAD synthetase
MANKKTIVVLASGVFDLLHLGHVKFLQDAKATGGKNSKLIVIIARDSTVEKIKGKKPIMAEDQRCALVEALKVVDKAVLGAENFDMGEVILKVKPDIIALGYDQEDMNSQVQTYVVQHKSPIKVVRIGKFGQNALDSSTKIKQKIIENKR